METKIHSTAKLENVQLGQYNQIGQNVEIAGFKNIEPGPIIIGDCNIIHNDTRILVGAKGITIGDWNVFHNNCTLIGDDVLAIGHNCWFGQYNSIDFSGGLHIGNGVTFGYSNHIWTHIGRGEQLEGWLKNEKLTVINDNAWLVGSNITILPGLTIGRNTTVLAHSVVTKDTIRDQVYAGVPAKQIDITLKQKISQRQKVIFMQGWAKNFCNEYKAKCSLTLDGCWITKDDDSLLVGCHSIGGKNKNVTFFNLTDKTYTKRLTRLERDFYRYIYGNKARFIPV